MRIGVKRNRFDDPQMGWTALTSTCNEHADLFNWMERLSSVVAAGKKTGICIIPAASSNGRSAVGDSRAPVQCQQIIAAWL